MQVSKDQIRSARSADLFKFCQTNHQNLFELVSNSLRFCQNHSISIKQGYSGYFDFATGEKGNSLDFLTKHLGYNFTNAVCALNGEAFSKVELYVNENKKTMPETISKFTPPQKNIHNNNVLAYLNQSRKISTSTIDRLIYLELLYQDNRNNCVFINYERDFAELRGTNTYKPFHGIVNNSRYDGYWSYDLSYFTGGAVNIIICESAIDAISLFELHKLSGNIYDNVAYCSISGVQKQSAIDRLNQNHVVYIAVDNDQAGQICRNNNKDLKYLIPHHKDWNEDLVRYRQNYKFFDLSHTYLY